MSDDLERQLQAFGQTLEARVGEPMRGTAGPVASARGHSGRRWAVLGAAACLTAVVAGLVILGGDDPQVSTEPTPATTLPNEPSVTTLPAEPTTPTETTGPSATTIADDVVPIATVEEGDRASSLDLNSAEPTAREPIPPVDALGVAQLGWALQRRSAVEAYGVFEASNCGEWLEAAALGGVPVRTDLYTRLGDEFDWLSLTYVDYGTTEAAARRLAAMEDPVASCGAWEQPADDLVGIDATTVSGGQAFGWRVGELREYAISGEDGLSLVVQGGFLSDDDWSDVLAGAASYLVDDPARGEVIGSDVEVLPPGQSLSGQSAAAGPSRAAPLMEGKRVPSAAFTETVPANVLDLPSQDWKFEWRGTESRWLAQDMPTAPECDTTAFEPLFDSYYVWEFYTSESLGLSLQTKVFDLPDGMNGALLADVYREFDDCQYIYGTMDPVVGLSPSPTLNVPDATGAVFDTQMLDTGGPIDSRFVDISVPGPSSRFVSISFRGEPRENVTVELIDDLVGRAQQYLFGDAYRPPG